MKKMVIRRRKKFRHKRELIAGLVIIVLALLILFAIKIFGKEEISVVTVRVSNVELREGEEIPELTLEVDYDKSAAKRILNRREKYKLEDLAADIQSGKACRIDQNADNETAGKYTASVHLNEEFQEYVDTIWKHKVNIIFEEGTIHVKSKYGDWDGKSFVLLNGEYVSGWYDIGNDTYYFDENDCYVSGEYEIDGRTYYFTEDGRFDTEKDQLNPTKPIVALTFDDGPGKYTIELLEALESYGAKATFFMMGSCVVNYPEAVEKMVEIGCELGNHTMTHADLTELSVYDIKKELNSTNKEIKNIVGKKAKYIRPPYGAVNSVLRETATQPLIMWSLDTLDWQYKNVKKVKKVIRNNIQDGDIILMHDIHETSVQAIIELLPELIEKGYQFATISELAEIRGVEMEAGVKYFNFYQKNE